MTSTERNIYSWSPTKTLKADSGVIQRTCNAFSIDPTNTCSQRIIGHSETHPRFEDEEIQSLFKCLAERRDKKTARHLTRLVQRWKDGVEKNQTDALEYESIAVAALDSNAPVRYGRKDSYSVPRKEKETFRDLYRVSQAFFLHNYDESTIVHRGVRDLSVAKLFAQALDSPNASKYIIDTSAISNFTATKAVSHDYSTGVVIEPELPRDNAVMMVDHIFPTSKPEDEIHVAGGRLALPPEKIIHLGNYSGDERKVQTTSKSLESPVNLSKEHLEDIFTIFEIMGEKDIGVRTQEGKEKIDNWFTAYQTHISDEKIETLRYMIEYIKKVDENKSWTSDL